MCNIYSVIYIYSSTVIITHHHHHYLPVIIYTKNIIFLHFFPTIYTFCSFPSSLLAPLPTSLPISLLFFPSSFFLSPFFVQSSGGLSSSLLSLLSSSFHFRMYSFVVVFLSFPFLSFFFSSHTPLPIFLAILLPLTVFAHFSFPCRVKLPLLYSFTAFLLSFISSVCIILPFIITFLLLTHSLLTIIFSPLSSSLPHFPFFLPSQRRKQANNMAR